MSNLRISNQELARLTEEALALATRYWASVEERPVYPATSGEQTTKRFSRPWSDEGLGWSVLEDFQSIAKHARISNGRFFGYVAGSGEPVGAIGDLLAAVLNQNVTSWRSAPAAVTIEQTVIGWLADAVGCAGYKGSLCGGGSMANLMALAMAREAKLPGNETGARPC
ncbi:MAG TPA: pyridoxal-dependent decarboxylase, partial [Nordella sp.]|nr:pyridoxal-dependent decarboxylase [Nordella sp.]